MKLSDLKKIAEAATPAPWRYDMGNWEVEGPRPTRYTIGSMTPFDRGCDDRGDGVEPNPIEASADGELIAAARNSLPALIAVAEAAARLMAFIEQDQAEPGDYEALLSALEAVDEVTE